MWSNFIDKKNLILRNPRVPCRSGVLPSMDLSKWAEYPTASHAQYVSNLEEQYQPYGK